MKRFYTISLVIILGLGTKSPFAQQMEFDLLIQNAQLYDGLSLQPKTCDILIVGDRIARVSENLNATAKDTIDAAGLVVCPGFIDVHAHIEPLALYPDAESHIRQGVTTALGGPDGGSPLPIGDYLDSLHKSGVGLNVAYLVGHNTIRNHTMGLVDRAPSDGELAKMKSLVAQAMDQGAFGISTGLKYLPGTFASTDEIVALSEVAGSMGGIYTSHLREEGLGLINSVHEAIEIASRANIRVVLTHHKVIGAPMWGASAKTLAMVDSARLAGLDVRIDQYPYTASHTGISVVIPPWALEGGRYDRFAERAMDPQLRDSIRKGIIYNLINDRGGNDLRRIQFAKIDWKPSYAGKTLHDLVADEMRDTSLENGAEMIIRIQEHRGANCIYHVIDHDDVKKIMQHPLTMVASDGRLTNFGEGHPHPRAYGTFPRVLGKYVREEGVLSLGDAIRKMTSLPAQTAQIHDRGVVKEGNFADLVIFDPDKIKDEATFQEPHQYPTGIHYVIINGKVTVEKSLYYPIRAGMILRKQRN